MESILPAITYLFLTAIGIGIIASKNGTPKTESYNIFSSILYSIPVWVILYWGGFFDALLKVL